MSKLYYETIKIETICKNGSEKMGAKAITNVSMNRDGSMKMQVSQFGKTMKEAEQKLLEFLTDDAEYIGSFNLKSINQLNKNTKTQKDEGK